MIVPIHTIPASVMFSKIPKRRARAAQILLREIANKHTNYYTATIVGGPRGLVVVIQEK